MLPTVAQSLRCRPTLTVLTTGLTETMWATSGSHRNLHHSRLLHRQDKDSPFPVQPTPRAQSWAPARPRPRLDHSRHPQGSGARELESAAPPDMARERLRVWRCRQQHFCPARRARPDGAGPFPLRGGQFDQRS
jgi:hypothetical protein